MRVGLLSDLDAFFLEHRLCGDLESEVQDLSETAVLVAMWCSCGGTFRRRDDGDACRG